MSLLTDHDWNPRYDSGEDDLVATFYVPALSAAVRYDRTTGYFSAGVLTLASRGLEGLIRAAGRMRLIVGCTLDQPEVEAIKKGESLRDTVGAHLKAMPLDPTDATEASALELLAWMIERGHLEVRVGIPCDSKRQPRGGTAIFHEKVGILEDKAGDRVAFSGSLNETPSGWRENHESFHVFTTWRGGEEHVKAEEASFQRLWNDLAKHCRVVDVPTAVREDLLRFLPKDGSLPRRLQDPEPKTPAPLGEGQAPLPFEGGHEPEPPIPPQIADQRSQLWAYLAEAPKREPGGERVGEATSAVEPWPHQVHTFERMYRAWPPRLLIADEVGLGKTIEAGLLIRQAWLAGRVRRALVLAPKAVLGQWQVELREKFNLNWPIYDGQRLSWYASPARREMPDREVARDAWHKEPFVIASSQLMRRQDRADELCQRSEPFDLIVVDEAHHARRKGAGGAKLGSPNRLLTVLQALSARTQALLLLTATPMQVAPIEVLDLVSLLGTPPAWTLDAFSKYFEKAALPSPGHEDWEFLASLFRATELHYGRVEDTEAQRLVPTLSTLGARKVLKALRSEAATERRQLQPEHRAAALRILRSVTPISRRVSRHTRALLRHYFTTGRSTARVAERDVVDEFVALSSAERSAYEATEAYIGEAYDQAKADERSAIGFVMTVYRRRLASSFAALRATLESRLAKVSMAKPPALLALEDDPDPDAEPDVGAEEGQAEEWRQQAAKVEERSRLEELLAAVKRLPTDTKASHLVGVLERLREAGYAQAIVFTQYTDTVDFLRDLLATQAEVRVACFSGRGGERRSSDGRWHSMSREDVKRLFRAGQVDVLLCTDAAAEGLNFQFCGALVNYDMPWNPMRVEQRIGRIDRLGQRFERIRIVNLHYQDTVETDIYMALRERISLFTQYVGRLQPILSAVSRTIADAILAGNSGDLGRAAMLSDLNKRVDDAQHVAFDLDDAAAADFSELPRAPAAYDLGALAKVLAAPDLLPIGVTAQLIGPSEWRYQAPGMSQPVRVTTDRVHFEEHPSSLELWSPGSPVFPLTNWSTT